MVLLVLLNGLRLFECELRVKNRITTSENFKKMKWHVLPHRGKLQGECFFSLAFAGMHGGSADLAKIQLTKITTSLFVH